MRVLGAKIADRGGPNVAYQDVGPQILGERRDVDFGSLVDRAASQEDLARLINPQPPPERCPFGDYLERTAVELEHTRPKIRPVTDETEESSHYLPPRATR